MLREALRGTCAAMLAFIVGLYLTTGFGTPDYFRASLIRPDKAGLAGVVGFAFLFGAGAIVGSMSQRSTLLIGVAAIYLGLAAGRFAAGAYLGADVAQTTSESFSLGFTVQRAIVPMLESKPAFDPVVLRILGVLLRVVAVTSGIVVGRWRLRARQVGAVGLTSAST